MDSPLGQTFAYFYIKNLEDTLLQFKAIKPNIFVKKIDEIECICNS